MSELMMEYRAIQVEYRPVVNYGWESGHGRVVLLHFEMCEQISDQVQFCIGTRSGS